ncbi:MAG: substrate-binding periplasmic protein [Aestuariibacter sp.]
MRLLFSKRHFLAMLLCCGLAPSAFSQSHIEKLAQDGLWLTEQYPPYHFEQEGKIIGLGITILNTIFERNQINFKLNDKVLVYPWARAVRELSSNPRAIVISMSHTEQRASLFKLSEPLFYESISLITLAEHDISLPHPDSIARFSIGAVRDDIGEKLVKEMTSKPFRMIHVQTSEELIQLLIRKRVKVIAYSKDIIDYQIRQLGLPRKDFKVLKVMRDMPSTVAFNKDTDTELFHFVNENIKKLREDGTIAELLKRLRQQ